MTLLLAAVGFAWSLYEWRFVCCSFVTQVSEYRAELLCHETRVIRFCDASNASMISDMRQVKYVSCDQNKVHVSKCTSW
jgi:hypothetical protein